MKDLKKLISIPLSNSDVEKYIPNVIIYTDLLQMSNKYIKDHLPIVILYETEQNSGHWTLLHKVPGGIEHFDSYGFRPDEEFVLIPKEFQLPHKLKDFLLKMSETEDIHFNEYMFQELAPGINTCGRWCILREMVGGNIDNFAKTIGNISNEFGLTRDEIVADIIS